VEENMGGLVLLVALGFAATANIVLGMIVFRREPQALVNRLFLGLALGSAVWVLTVLMIIATSEPSSLLFWIRLAHAVAALIPAFVVALVYAFPSDEKYPYGKVFITFFLGLMLAGVSFTPLIIENVKLPLEEKQFVYGSHFYLYPLFFAGMALLVFVRLFRQLRRSQGLVRYQLRYFLGGILAAFVMASLANLFSPFIGMKVIDLRSFGPLSSIIMVGSISYAIVKYRLMDIHFALRKLITYGLSIVILATVYVAPVLALEKAFEIAVSPSFFYYYTVVVAVTATILFQVLQDRIQAMVDRHFYRGAYDYFDTLTAGSKAMASILNRDELLRFFVNRVVETVGMCCGVFFLKTPTGVFKPIAQRYLHTCSPIKRKLAPGENLLSYLEENGEVLLLTDLRAINPREKSELLAAEMSDLQAEVAVPVLMEGKLVGVFLLGSKLSGEPYSSQDVKLFSALASQLSVSLKNAQLYQDVLMIKRYLENILDNMGNGLVAVDVRGTIITFNSAAERLTGRTAAEVRGQSMDRVLSPDLCALLRQTIESGAGASEVEAETVSSEGSRRYLCCSTAAIELPETGERGAILVLSDVTRIKELEQERSQVQRLAALGEVAAGLAHEVKNPLVSIKTFAELLPEKYDDQEFRNRFSRIVSQEIERINQLLRNLLSFTKDTRLNCEAVNVAELMDEILLLLSPQIDAQGITVWTNYAPGLPPVWADRNQLKQAVFNVCLNSIQAMPNGGELRVSVVSVPPAHEEQRGVGTAGGKIKVIVEDTGVGIAAQQKDRVFDPFFTTKAEGSGIGLSISHKIIVDHGGTIQVRSAEGEGAVFEICLPVTGRKVA
jgi:PAS domain S-box-containing protein